VKTLARLALAHPAAALVAALAATLAFGLGLPRLEPDVGYRAFLGAEHPSVRRFDAFLARYEGGLPMALVYTCEDAAPCRSVFDPPALEMARAVSDAVAAAPGVRRVESPTRTPVLVPARPPRPPLPRRFFENGALAPDRDALAARALGDRLWRGSLVSEDGRTAALLIEVEDSRGAAAVAAWDAVERATAPWTARGYVFRAVGGPVEFVVAGGELERAARRLVPVMVLLVAGGLLLLLRSPPSTAALLGTIGLGVLWTHGLLGWLGFGQNTITQILAPVLLVVGTCDGLHLIARFAAERAEAGGAAEPEALHAALLRAVDDVAAPCLMMTLTTAGGFLAFLSSDLAAFARFGAVAAFGIGCSLVLTFSVLPVLLVRFPPPPAADVRASGTLEHGLLRLARAVRSRSGAVLLATALLAAAAGAGVRHLPVDATFEDLYGERSRVVQWAAAVRERLRPPDSLEIELTAPPGTDLASPEALAVLGRVTRGVEEQRHVGRVRSLLDPLSWMHRLWTGDDPRLERPAETARANRFLLELLARDPATPVRRFADLEGGRLRVSIETDKPPRDELDAMIHGASEAARRALPPGWSHEVTGPAALVHDMIEEIQRTQVSSFLQAWATIAVLVTLFLRSVGSGLLVALTTALPVAVTLGAMGLLGIPLDPGSAMVAAVVLGISDDDAIHFLTQYRRMRAGGLGPGEAVESAIVHTGRAIVTTSLTLALGFSTLALSPWKSVASFGLLSAIAILAALGAVLVVLPAAIHATAARVFRKGTELGV
jgi:predicted RND superfamily exporter protein